MRLHNIELGKLYIPAWARYQTKRHLAVTTIQEDMEDIGLPYKMVPIRGTIDFFDRVSRDLAIVSMRLLLYEE